MKSVKKMKADSASHLLRQPVSFELFLFAYLACALILQKINIYKTNYHLIDFNLVVFTLVILSRRLAWCVLQELQAHWTKPSKPPPSKSLSNSLEGRGRKSSTSESGVGVGGWSLNWKRWMVFVCTLMVIVWSIVSLIQQTSLFNLLFLFYPLLLYLSLFGFTLEPRFYRARFQPPKTFLEHVDFTSPERLGTHLFSGGDVVMFSVDSEDPMQSSSNNTSHSEGCKNCPNCNRNLISSSSHSGPSMYHRSQIHSTHNEHGSSHPNDSASTCNTGKGSSESQATDNSRRLHMYKVHIPDTDHNTKERAATSEHNGSSVESEVKYTWEYALMLPATPDEVRSEVDVLLSDLIVRLKQTLFNSLLCAYYVGIIPMLFADNHLYYDKWWCVEHAFLVWANSFVILSSHLFPPSYCQILYRCALHLGCWTRCVHDENASTWSPDTIWPCDAVVQWNGESFRGEGLQNVAIPCHSSQEFFYLLFHSRLNLHTWLLLMQCIIVAFQIVVLLRSIFWYQTLSMSVFLAFNYFIFYKLLYNRLWSRHALWLT